MMLIIWGMQRSIACRLENVVEKLTALLAVLNWILTLHRHQQRNKVWQSYGALDHRIYVKIYEHMAHKKLVRILFIPCSPVWRAIKV